MVTISSISSLSPLIQSLQSSSANASSSVGEQLLAEVAQAQANSGSTTDPLLQTLVSLGSGSASPSAETTPLTYNAKGLLNQIENSLLLSDPLLQSADTGSGDSGAGQDSSLLNSLLSPGQGTGGATADSSNPGAVTSTGTPGPNVNWAQILQKNPSLASAFAESQMNQGILNILP